MSAETRTLGGAVGRGVFDVASDEAVARNRALHEQRARESAAEIEDACHTLAVANALPRRGWRDIAHVLHARHVYAAHIQPFESDLTYSEIAARLNRIEIPRFRRGSPWTAQAVAEVRKVVAALRAGEMLLPDSQ